MTKIYHLLIATTGLLLLCGQGPPFSQFDPPLSRRIANYTIDAHFDPAEKRIRADLQLEWRNLSADTIREVPFHLYMNAFRDGRSTFMRELEAVPPELENNWGYCEIRRVILADGRDVSDRWRYVQPDDRNSDDKTVISLALPEPLPPGDTLNLKMSFETRLPALVERSGFREDFYLVCQWFPKIGVYTAEGWNCHQYHANSEFFADFGIYDVTLTLPESLIVGATGMRVAEERNGKGEKTLRYYAEDVHDFAWCADPDFAVRTETVDSLTVTLLHHPEHVALASRWLEAAAVAYRYFSRAYGRYPYPGVTIVDSPIFNAVMEYPTFFLTGNFDGSGSSAANPEPVPLENRFPERLTIHEFGHQWWYGMVANNEFEEAWLDEGITEYATAKAFESAYGKILYHDPAGRPLPVRDFRKDRYLDNPAGGVILAPAWSHQSFGTYYIYSYVKPKLLLYTLDNYYGEATWETVMRSFFQRWKFRHPRSADFLAVVSEVVGEELHPFLRQYLETPEILDYRIADVSENRVTIEKEGQLAFPVTIRCEFAGGRTATVTWDGRSSDTTFDFSGRPPLRAVTIDPDDIIEFELRRDNNR